MSSFYDLMVAPNGARLGKADHPAIPITVSELSQTAAACAMAGATAIHLHVRDQAGRHSLDPDLYRHAVAAVAGRSAIRVQISTEAAGRFDPKTQAQCLRQVRPADASVSIREMARDPVVFAQTYHAAQRAGTDIQHILYDPSDVTCLLRHYANGTIPETSRRAIFVLGGHGAGHHGQPDDLRPFLEAMGSDDLRWTACAFGPREQDCLLAALDLGGQVRLGFENNVHRPDGTVFPDNAASVAAFVSQAETRGFVPREAAA